MSLTIAIIVFVILALALLGLLTGAMAWPRRLHRHKPAGGRPAARMRWFSGSRRKQV
jgi:hypothetical protein